MASSTRTEENGNAPESAPSDALPAKLRTRIYIVSWALLALFNVAWAIIFPLRTLYFREPWIGLRYDELGWLGFIRATVGAVSPLAFGVLADRSGRQKIWILLAFILASIATTLFLFGRTFWEIAAITVFDGLCLIAYNVNLNVLVSMTLSENARGREFGQFRIAGSIGYASASFFLIPLVSNSRAYQGLFANVAGVFRRLGADIPSPDPTYIAAFLTGTTVYLVCVFLTLFGIREVPHDMRKPSSKGSWKRLIRNRNLMILYLALAVSSIGGSTCFQFFANHMKETFGLSNDWIGIVIGIQTVAEIPALILIGWASDHWGRKPLLLVAFFSSGIRWSLIGLAPSVGWIIPAQLLWGLGFSGYIVGVALMTELVEPENRGSAFGLMNLAFAIGNMIGPPIGGYIAEHAGLPMVFRLGGLSGILGGVGLVFLLRPTVVTEPVLELAGRETPRD